METSTELPHELLLRVALSGKLGGEQLTMRERCKALVAAIGYYTREELVAAIVNYIREARKETMTIPIPLPPTLTDLTSERELERAVDRVIEHQVNELAKQVGEDDEYVKFMRATRRTAVVLPFPQSQEIDHG